MLLKQPFDFEFKGYSVWLELAQIDRDLEKAVANAALDAAIYPIPEPHCTVLYGVSHLTECEAKTCFRDKVVPSVNYQWPEIKVKGSHVGVSFDGVDGEEMDMSWMELTLQTSSEHEALVDKVHSCFYDSAESSSSGDTTTNNNNNKRAGTWKPHISIAYDNPHDTVLDNVFADKLFTRFPTLLGQSSREVVAISLWRTKGKVWEWQCLDKVLLNRK